MEERSWVVVQAPVVQAPVGRALRSAMVLSPVQADVEVAALPAASWRPVWAWPLATPASEPTSGFGPRWGRVHEGVDLAADAGDEVLAVAPGRVVQAGPRGTLGLAVELDHGEGWTSRYGHLSGLEVAEGEQVRAGEVLGQAGATGRTTGPHLHLEVRRDGVAVDPCKGLQMDLGVDGCSAPRPRATASMSASSCEPFSPPGGGAPVCVR